MAHTLLPDPNALCLDHIAVEGDVIVSHVATTAQTAACPACRCPSARIHSRYRRTLQDLPWQGDTVRFLLTVPKFFCDRADCPRKVFAQRIEEIARRYQRKTTRLDELLQRLTWRIGAAEAARLARLVGLRLRPDAPLYRFKRAECSQSPARAPEALGIDDFAFRRGHSHGTILIDLATHTPEDLLPDRERASVEKWLREHPGAQVICRDRSAIYADAIREAAPEATAVADRFHLLKNVREAFQAQIGKENKAIREALVPKAPSLDDAGPVTQARRVQRRSQESRQGRLERWQKVHELFNQGYFKKEIARMTGLDTRTVRAYLRCPTFPERKRGSPVDGPLTPYKEYILQLWREVKERPVPSPRALSWLLILPERRTPEQTALGEKACASCPTLVLCRDLVLSFQEIMRRRAVGEMDGWLERAETGDRSAFATFVRGIRADMKAVRAAFTLEWSNGPTEGNVNRLKFIKRQGYGRTGFELLRRRVLPLAA